MNEKFAEDLYKAFLAASVTLGEKAKGMSCYYQNYAECGDLKMTSDILWNQVKDGDCWLESSCGEFEIHIDRVYGYLSLRRSDSGESLAENISLGPLTRIAKRLRDGR